MDKSIMRGRLNQVCGIGSGDVIASGNYRALSAPLVRNSAPTRILVTDIESRISIALSVLIINSINRTKLVACTAVYRRAHASRWCWKWA